MVTTPLFDIDGIDLAGVACTPEEVGRINPQCGDMRQLDHVIWFSENFDEALGVKLVRDDEFWVPVHIPGRPLLPGVLMIEAVAQLGAVLYRKKIGVDHFVGFTRCDDVVFRKSVVPGDTIHLLVQEVSVRRRRFISLGQAMRDGSIIFEARITGMPV